MAIGTGNFVVSAKKAVLRVSVMVKERFGPGRTSVTGVTLIAVMTVVLIILEVAGRAGYIHFVLEGVV